MNNADQNQAALLVIDMQVGVVQAAYAREKIVRTISELVARARVAHVPVIWVQHSNGEMAIHSANWQIIPELTPLKDEIKIQKVHGDAFEATGLQSYLDQRHVRRLIVTGAQTEACIRATIHGAFVRGYDTVLVGDGHTTEDLTEFGLPAPEKLIELTNTYWKWQTGERARASVEKASEVKL